MDLIIVESPNKVKTIKQFVDPKKFVVEASVGHITRIADSGLYNMGIDPSNWKADFVIDEGKEKVVSHLKELVSRADTVYLCTDPDREGEAIAYHLKEVLKIPAKKCKRSTFHEVTKKVVLDALDHPRKIDMDLVDAALARAKLDKVVGYRLSPIARRKISARSVGRCQSAALKMIVEREDEITKFKPETFYEIWLNFVKNNNEYKAQYKGLLGKKNKTTLSSKSDADKVIQDCNGKDYKVHSIESKDRIVSPKPPFITSTFQQEVSSKLGYSVKKATDCAQRLFEGIQLGGQHVSLVTYLRTDSTSMNDEFEQELRTFIENSYGKQYLRTKLVKKKSKNEQDGHECFRVVDLNMTPEKLSSYINDQQLLKVYKLIYDRTVQSLMSDAVITDTEFVIVNGNHKFSLTEHAEKFDGFRKIYSQYEDEDLNKGLDVFVGETLTTKGLDLFEKQTTPPRRYSESSLIKQLESTGIGRPSTFSSIISILLDPGRGYCEEQGKAISPTEKGIQLSNFLDQAFPKIINYDYSANLEDSLDLIAKGKLKEVDFLNQFYTELEKMIKDTKTITIQKPQKEYVDGMVCPQCGSKIVKRTGRFGTFGGCDNYPKCKFTTKLD